MSKKDLLELYLKLKKQVDEKRVKAFREKLGPHWVGLTDDDILLFISIVEELLEEGY